MYQICFCDFAVHVL